MVPSLIAVALVRESWFAREKKGRLIQVMTVWGFSVGRPGAAAEERGWWMEPVRAGRWAGQHGPGTRHQTHTGQ